MCLLFQEPNVLLCGDHILGDITPNITMWTSMTNPLGKYLESLDLVAGMHVKRALTGHRSMVEDCARRIAELKEHHRRRLRYERWDDVHPVQKLFATGEAIAHLQYLESTGIVVSTRRDGRILYQLTPSA
jgi:glyoxylase-like metal-dependent hydrolase (beta-lactamase superfamily II)